jgi:uncharacterized protein YbjQ (UPF0145 family)
VEILQFLADSLELIVFVILLAVGFFRGRHNERRHLESLRRREQKLRHVLVFATRYPPASAVPLDPVLVSGGCVVAGDYFKMFVAGLRKLVGGNFAAYETLVARGRREALLRLKAEARAAGCRAVYNVRYVTTQIRMGRNGGPAAFEVLAYGTAFAQAAGAVADSPFHRQAGEDDVDGEPAFDLMKNPGTRLALALAGAGLAYLCVEYFGLQDYDYAGAAPTGWLAALAAVAALALGRFCRRHRVPWAETLGVAGLVGALAFGAVHYLALRLNDLTDPAPAAATVYIVQEDGHLRPRQPGPPALHLPGFPGYWAAQGVGSEYPVVVRRGWPGFWQYDRAAILERVRAYYEAHPDAP